MIPRPRVPAAGAWWRGIDTYAKRRVAVLAGVIAAAAAIVVLVLVLAAGGESQDPARLVPADALAYVEVNTDSASSADRGADALARKLPMLSDQVAARLGSGLRAFAAAGLAPGGTRAGWLGDDAAVAMVGGARLPATVELLAVSNQPGANAFAERLTGDRSATRYRGVALRTGRRASVAITHGFLVYGPTLLVKLIVDTAIGDGSNLADDPDYSAATGGLPGDRLALAYVSSSGANRLLGGASTLRPLASGSAVRGVGIALNTSGDDVELTARSAFHPGDGGKPPLAALTQFDPRLPARLPADSLVYAGVGTAGATLKRSLSGLGGLGSAVSTAFLALVPNHSTHSLGRLLPLLGKETAVVVQSGPGSSSSSPSPPEAGLVSVHVDPKQVKAALPDGSGSHVAHRLDGTTLRVGGDAAEVARLSKPQGSLDTTAGYSNAMVEFSTTPTLQAYLDLNSLVPLFEAAGLAENPAYASFAPEIRRLRALGLVVSSDSDSVTVQARLTVAD